MSGPPAAHQILGRYQLLVPVARGGMGQVWLARLRGARGWSKLVAIKTLLPNAADRPRLEGMLAREARLAALIEHANVVHTIELGEHDGLLYLVMDWVDGEPLGFLQMRATERGGMPLVVAVSLVGQVLAGLHAAHELRDDGGPLGVVHRDVSPHNVLVTYEGIAKVLDFGIAKATEKPSGDTGSGEVKGKFSYMAPEQILGEVVDRRCDVFAAGILLYWLTTGQHPFKNHNTAAVIHAITSAAPAPPASALVPDLPEALGQVLTRALAKDPDARFATAEEMRAALQRALPEAFGEDGRSAIRAFMNETVGDRRAARREAIRRAQVAADGESSSGLRSLSASSQSASSLGAISISQPAPGGSSPSFNAGPNLTVQPPPRRRPKGPWLAATAGVLLALGSLTTLRLGGSESETHGAATGVAPGVPLTVHAPSPPPSSSAVVASPAPSSSR